MVVPHLRRLRYPAGGGPPREKGVDVELAVAATEWVITDRCDVAVVFSHDTDLAPLVETVCRIAGPERIETASWVSSAFRQRLRSAPPVFHHGIDLGGFLSVERRVNYAHRTR